MGFQIYSCGLLHLLGCINLTNLIGLIMVDNLFAVCLFSVCKYFIKHFLVYVHWRHWPVVFFVVVVSLSGFEMTMILTSQKFGSPTSASFLKNLSSLLSQIEFFYESIRPLIFNLESFLLLFQSLHLLCVCLGWWLLGLILCFGWILKFTYFF